MDQPNSYFQLFYDRFLRAIPAMVAYRLGHGLYDFVRSKLSVPNPLRTTAIPKFYPYLPVKDDTQTRLPDNPYRSTTQTAFPVFIKNRFPSRRKFHKPKYRRRFFKSRFRPKYRKRSFRFRRSFRPFKRRFY
nr:MAG: hypothetical protein [Cressdnaviricota sp.]